MMMVKNRIKDSEMNDFEMERILSRRDEIQSSSGFISSVMEAVRAEAAAPPPIPFPWRRALPVLALGAAALVLVVVVGVAAIVHIVREPVAVHADKAPWFFNAAVLQGEILHGRVAAAAGWTVVSLLLAFFSVKFSMRIAGARA
jgi:hypothetical protein